MKNCWNKSCHRLGLSKSENPAGQYQIEAESDIRFFRNIRIRADLDFIFILNSLNRREFIHYEISGSARIPIYEDKTKNRIKKEVKLSFLWIPGSEKIQKSEIWKTFLADSDLNLRKFFRSGYFPDFRIYLFFRNPLQL